MDICKRRGLYEVQVFVLSRSGFASEALNILLHKLGDVLAERGGLRECVCVGGAR